MRESTADIAGDATMSGAPAMALLTSPFKRAFVNR